MPQSPSPWLQPPVSPCSALLSLQDALLSLGAALDATALRDALRHALVTLLPAVVGGGASASPGGLEGMGSRTSSCLGGGCGVAETP